MSYALNIVRRIIKKVDGPLLSPLGSFTEVAPSAGIGTDPNLTQAQRDAQIAEFVRNQSWGRHASCSAPIGPVGDRNAVLDSHFRVQGTSGLRVVDASVFPRIPGFFIVVPIYMISEKAAVVIDLESPRGDPGQGGGGGGPAATEVEPNGDAASATALAALPANIQGRIEASDQDHFSFEVTAAGDYLIETRLSGSEPTDTYIALHGPSGDELAFDDDGAGNLLSRIQAAALAPGRYTLMVRGYDETTTGPYLLHVARAGGAAAD